MGDIGRSAPQLGRALAPIRDGAQAPSSLAESASAMPWGADPAEAATTAISGISPRVLDELATAPPARRRAILRRIWDEPLRDRPLRRLRETVLDHEGCLGGLSDLGRRTLIWRAGLDGRRPASRRVIARRLGISPGQALRLELSSLRQLTGAGTRGLCNGGASGGVSTDLRVAGSGELGSAAGSSQAGSGEGADRTRTPTPAGGVLGDTREGGPIDLEDGLGTPPEALLLLMLMLLGPLAAIAFASRRHGGALVAARPASAATAAHQRPLLFLDVNGAIALSPSSPSLPPGRVYTLGYGMTYVSDRARELVDTLASRFELVRTGGWEHDMDNYLLALLGLEEEPPVVAPGREGNGSAEQWRIDRVDRYAGSRPAAWIDDHFDDRHLEWAADRRSPTLLVPVDPRVGISDGHVERLLAWADKAERADTVERAPKRRLGPLSPHTGRRLPH